MKSSSKLLVLLVFVFVALLPVSGYSAMEQDVNDPLSYWNCRDAKKAIISYVTAVTSPCSKSFIPQEDRLATFDMDGTVTCEKPTSLEMVIAIDQMKKIANESPAARANQPYKAAYEGDTDFLRNNFLLSLYTPFTGWDVSDFQAHVSEFMKTSRHPRFKTTYNELFYLPMVQLIDYLKTNGFTVYVVSGSSLLVVRAACNTGIQQDAEHCIGTMSATTVVDYTDAGPELVIRGFSYDPVDLQDGKVQNIFNKLGRFPVLAFGNTAGDFEMLKSTYSKKYRHLALLLNHDDAKREYSYPDDTKRAAWLNMAKEQGWQVVSMRDDFNAVFSIKAD